MDDLSRQIDKYFDGDPDANEIEELPVRVAEASSNTELFTRQCLMDEQLNELLEVGFVQPVEESKIGKPFPSRATSVWTAAEKSGPTTVDDGSASRGSFRESNALYRRPKMSTAKWPLAGPDIGLPLPDDSTVRTQHEQLRPSRPHSKIREGCQPQLHRTYAYGRIRSYSDQKIDSCL